MKASEVRAMSVAELNTKLDALKKDLFMLRMQHATNQLDNPQKLVQTKRDIARVKTMIGDNQKEDEPITIGKVKEMVDGAIRKASGVKLGRKLSKRHTDADGRILLYEKDFDL